MKLFNDEPVVAGVSMNLYRNEVTVIVGNKHSGKTTLINLLAGITPASSGVVTINGHNVAKERQRLNHITGYCTQHDVLFRKLTCLEHLTFYLKLKGHYSSHYENWNSELLRCIGLSDHSHNYPWMLNICERRKLTIACSFVGENQIIFLDEPTYGLNAKSKKDVCHFLQNMKQGRTILMSTHSMDEAETLADRIAIIEEGGLKCYGSPAFLKRIFGVGYHLKVTREPGCSIKNFLKTVQTIFPEATFSGSNSTEVTIALPEGLDFFIPNFLEQLDKRTDELKISNIRLSAFSLYDVFHGLGEGFELRENIDSAHSSICETMEEQNEFDKDGFLSERLFKRMGNYEQYTGSRLILHQLKAIFFKKWILFTRPLITALAILFLPAGVVLFGIGLDQDTMSASDVKPLEFSLKGLEDTLIPIWKNDSTPKAKVDSYEKQFQSAGSHVMSPSQKDPNEFFIYWANKYDDESYNKKFIFGLELTIPDTTMIFYQHWMTQAQGVAVQIMINSEIVTALGENYSVQTGVEYVQSFEEQLYLKMQVKTIACIAIVMCLVPLLLVTEVICERTNGARHLQSVSGVNTCVFWLGTYIFDLLVYLFVAATIVLVLMYSPEYYIRCGHWNATVTLLVVFGLTVFPFLYAFQSVFYSAITGSITMLIYNISMGLLMSMVVALTKIYAQSMKDYLGLIDNLLGAVSPNYLLSYSLLTLVSRTVKSTVNGTCVSHSWSNETRLLQNIEMFVVQFFVSWLMIACVEYEIYRYLLRMYLFVCRSKDKNKTGIFMFCQDTEVRDESIRVETLAESPENNNEMLLMVNAEKTYSNCYYTNRAVYPTSLGVSQNESFGLLGKSNSGKTSILKMIIGETQLTAGDIYVLKHNVRTELKKANTKLGYCPENNALHDMLTGRETLYLYGRIRGVPDKSLEDVVEVVVDFITLRPYEDKVVRRYSHNNKRKLSLGIAIMGKPVLLVLDMPTVGMGRMSRRIMWNVLHLIQISGHSLIIATRSIEECEALCMRMAFMSNGRLISLGSPQDLKHRYGQGYWVVLHANVYNPGPSKILDDVIVFLHHTVQSTQVSSRPISERVIVRDADSCEIHYPPSISLISLFRGLILAKERFDLRAFSVQQLTLRHIFLMLINDRASF